MQTNEVALATKLWFTVKVIAHSTMSHDLGYVRLMLTRERLLVDPEALTGFCKRSCNKTIEPFFVATLKGLGLVDAIVSVRGRVWVQDRIRVR
jgi:hypothetical protein